VLTWPTFLSTPTDFFGRVAGALRPAAAPERLLSCCNASGKIASRSLYESTHARVPANYSSWGLPQSGAPRHPALCVAVASVAAILVSMTNRSPAWLLNLDHDELDAGASEDLHRSVRASLPKIYMGPVPEVIHPRETKWDTIWAELYLLVCTKDKKYRAVRQKLAKAKKSSTPVIVAIVASAVGKHCGTLGAALVPVVSAMLAACVMVGSNWVCVCLQPYAATLEQTSRKIRRTSSRKKLRTPAKRNADS
jgi:hypothetical protein